jgi:hypothetical protein
MGMRASTVVVLPAPFGPTVPNISPTIILKLTPFTARVWPYRLMTFSTTKHS